MAGGRVGTIFAELDIDFDKMTKKEQQIVQGAKQAAEGVERNWRVVGEKSDAMYAAMEIRARKAYEKITSVEKISAEEIAKAQLALDATITKINQKRIALAEKVAREENATRYAAAEKAAAIAANRLSAERIISSKIVDVALAESAKISAIREAQSSARAAQAGLKFERSDAAPMLIGQQLAGSGFSSGLKAQMEEEVRAQDKAAAAAKRTAAEKERLAAANAKTSASFSSLTPVIVTNYLSYLALQKSVNAVTDEITKGITSVSEYNVEVATATGFITTFSEQAHKGDIAGAFREAHKYATQLVPTLEELDARTIGTGKDLNLVYQSLVKNGVQLDITNSKQVEGFLAITNTLKMLFPLQKDQLQIQQEISGLMDGEFKSSDKLAKLLVAKDPQLKDHLVTWRETHKVIENVADLLPGMNAAVGLLNDDWSVVGSTLETIHTKILRDGFKPAVADIIDITKELISTLADGEGKLTPMGYQLQQGIADWYRQSKLYFLDIAAEIQRLSMLLDKFGGTMTSAGMLITGPGSALGIDSSRKRFEAFAAANVNYQERYQQGDKRLQELAEAYIKVEQEQAKVIENQKIVDALVAAGEERPKAGKAPTLYIPPEENDKAGREAKKAADDYANSVENLLDKVLPLEAEQRKYAEDLALINKLHAEGKLKGERYALAIKNLEENTSAYKDEVKMVADGIKDAVAELESWEKAEEELDALMVSTLPENEQKLEAIRQKYIETTQAVWDLYDAKRIDENEAERRNAVAEAERDAAIAGLRQVKEAHKETTDEVSKLWEHSFERMTDLTADFLATGKSDFDQFGSYFAQMVSQMVVTWGAGQLKMGNTAAGAAMGGNAGVFGSMTVGSNPMLGLTSVGMSAINEMINPGSYMSSLTSLQGTAVNGLRAVGANNLAVDLADMGATSFGSGVSGIGTFAVDMLSGKSFKQSAVEGAASAAGFAIGNAVGGPIGGMIGATLATMGAGSLFGEDKPWVRRWYDGVQSEGGKFNAPKDEFAPLFDQAQGAITEYVNKFPVAMRDQVLSAFDKEWGSKSWNSGKEDNLQEVGKELAAWLQASVSEAMGQAVLTVAGNELLTEEMVSSLKSRAAAGEDLSGYFQSLLSLTTTITNAVDSQGMDRYELAIRGINDEFAGLGYQLKELGVDLEKFTALERDRSMAIRGSLPGAGDSIDQFLQAAKGFDFLFTNFYDAVLGQNTMSEEGRLQTARDTAGGFRDLTASINGENKTIAALSQVNGMLDVLSDSRLTDSQWIKSWGGDWEDAVVAMDQAQVSLKGLRDQLLSDLSRPMDDIINSQGKNELQLDFEKIQDQYEGWIKLGQQAEDELGDLFDFEAWSLKAATAAEILAQDLIDNFVDPVADAVKNQIRDLQFSDLAPVQSKAMFDEEYQALLAGAKTGEQGAVSDFLSFTNEYLQFNKDFGGNYQSTFDTVLADIKSIKQEPVKVEVNADGVKQAVIDGFLAVLGQMTGPDGQPIQITINEQVLGEVVVRGMLYSPNFKMALSDAGYGQFSPVG